MKIVDKGGLNLCRIENLSRVEKVDTAGKFLKITTLYIRPALPSFLHSLARHIEFTFAMGK